MNKPSFDASERARALGQYMSAARQEQGVSTRNLATMTGITRAAIVRIEAGEVQQPSADNLVRLARALELNELEVLQLAGVTIPHLEGSLDVMLRAEYDLPPEAIALIKQNIQDVIDEYGQP